MQHPPLTVEDYVRAFGLKQKGSEYKGPCPLSGCDADDDGFHVKLGRNGQPSFGCRKCMDEGQDASGERAKQVFALLRGTSNAPALSTCRNNPISPRKS